MLYNNRIDTHFINIMHSEAYKMLYYSYKYINEVDMKYKIAIGGIHIESSTFTPYVSGVKDFMLRRGEEIILSHPYLEKFKEKVDIIPLVHARALPGGVVSEEFYNEWEQEFLDRLADAKNDGLDGVLFDIHGAMSVENKMDAEGELAVKVRNLVGANVIVSTTMDLHGNISDDLFNSSNLLTCYRTAPHIDQLATRERAFSNMMDILDGKFDEIYKAKVDIPILLPGEKTSTEVEPGKTLYSLIDDICMDENIIDASIWMGFPWADQARCHGSVVITGNNEKKVREKTEFLSKAFWNYKDEFEFIGPTANLENSINEALYSKSKPFFISDTGDNPGAGGAGDMVIVLRELLKIQKEYLLNKTILIASIKDHESIHKIYNKIEGSLTLSLGGKIDKTFGDPVEINVEIVNLFKDDMAGRSALVSSGNIWIIITENRYQYGSKKAFEKAGVQEFTDFDIIVVKMGYLEPDLSRVSKGWVMALTPGAVNQDLTNMRFDNRRKPLYPFENNFDPNLSVMLKKHDDNK